MTHTFDAANRVTSCTYPDGTTINKTYTNRNLLSGLAYGNDQIISLSYGAQAVNHLVPSVTTSKLLVATMRTTPSTRSRPLGALATRRL